MTGLSLLTLSITEQKFLILVNSSLSIIFHGSSFGVISEKNHCNNQGHPDFLLGVWLLHSSLHSFVFFLHVNIQLLVAQTVKNLSAIPETQVWFLGWEDPLEEGMATHSVFLPGEFHGQRRLGGYSPWGHKKLDMTEWLTLSHCHPVM